MKRESEKKSLMFILSIAVIVLLFWGSINLWSAPKSADDALQVVDGWLLSSPNPLGETLGQQIIGVETYSDTNGTTLYYVVSLEPTGFVIVAPDDLIEPIIAFTRSGTYEASDDNPLGALVNKDLDLRIAKVQELQVDLERRASIQAVHTQSPSQTKWSRLQRLAYSPFSVEGSISNDDRLYEIDDMRIPPLTQSKWGQSLCCYSPRRACYNYYTPQANWINYPHTYYMTLQNGDADNFLAGCVAIAMAQVMYFHKYPQERVGTASYEVGLKLPLIDGTYDIRNENLTLRGGDGRGGPYKWELMVPDPDYLTTNSQRQAIGALCYDAGVSINMIYGGNSSGAYTTDTADAFKNTFFYTNAIKGCHVTYDKEYEEWNWHNIGPDLNAMVNPNLDAGYPVILGIRRTEGGHAVVADGYGYQHATLYHHLNMGWNGFDDAWYNLPDVNCTYRTYSVIDECIYNIFPTNEGEIVSGRVTDRFGRPIAGVWVETTINILTLGNLLNPSIMTITSLTDEQGIYALVGVPPDTTCTVKAFKFGYKFADRYVTTGTSEDYKKESGNVWSVNFIAEYGHLLTN